jgi:hypothetical protein
MSVVDKTIRRIFVLLETCLKTSEGITIKDVKYIYDDDKIKGDKQKEHFLDDCHDLIVIRNAMFGSGPYDNAKGRLPSKYIKKRPRLLKLFDRLHPAEHFLPELYFDGIRLQVVAGASPFMKKFRDNRETYSKLAAAVVNGVDHNGIKVSFLPASGTLFLGFGTTIHTILLALMRKPPVPLDIATTSVEAIAALHRLARHGHETKLYVPTGLTRTEQASSTSKINYGEVDWKEGTIYPTEDPITITAVLLSFEIFGPGGSLITSKRGLSNVVEKAIEEAERVIIVADQTKLRTGSGKGKIELPKTKINGIGYLVTDAPLPRNWSPPDWLQSIVIKSDSSESAGL